MLRRYHRFAVVLVTMMLATPMVVGILSSGRTSLPSWDGEALAPAPAFPRRIVDWLNLPNQIDAYLSNHFGLRRDMIHAWSVVAHLWLRSGNAMVQVGRDGWLFYRGSDMLRQSAGLVMRKSRVIESADTINSVRSNLAARGVRFIFASPPNSAAIYPDMLPTWARNEGRPTEYDVLLEALAARGVHTVDLRPHLLAARAKGAVFFETGTHWSARGALAAFNAVAVAAGHGDWQLGSQVALAPPIRIIGQDLARMLGIADDVAEQTQLLMLAPGESERFDSFVIATFITKPKLPGGPTIMVLGDSFTAAQFPPLLLANNVRFAWTHHRLCEFDWKWIERFHPDEVWWMTTERDILCNPGGRPKGMPATGRPDE